MFTVRALVLPFFYLLTYCQAAYVDTLPQCSIKDTDCIKGVYQHVMENIGSTGIEELGVPPLDPMDIKDVSVTIMKAVTITIKDGSAKGMGKCVFNKFDIDWEKEKGFLNVTCAVLTVKGKFVVSGENAELQSIIGSKNLNGQGKAKIKLENTNVNVEFTIRVLKKDGEIYLQISNKNFKYTYDIGHAHFITENVIIANNDLSQIISSYLNENWKQTLKQYGSEFMDTALNLFVGLVGNVLEKIPANKYITEDLNSYVKN